MLNIRKKICCLLNFSQTGSEFCRFFIKNPFIHEKKFDVCEDTGSPIIEDAYAMPFRCNELQKLTVKIDKTK